MAAYEHMVDMLGMRVLEPYRPPFLRLVDYISTPPSDIPPIYLPCSFLAARRP